ncbi:MAG: response regulator transcription factor [Candidatus Sericytochromatia bacterium]|nr:response regulator transcription factor [Candidatus Tanganyikabacteria bacterium]
MKTRILVVEDEAPVLQGLVDLLAAKGYDVVSAATGPEGLAKAGAARPDLILLDVMLPGISGYDILRKLRAQGADMPVVMLTAKGAEIDKVLAFELGVDDYVTKPFSILELLGRIQAVLRRTQRPAGHRPAAAALVLGDVEVDFGRLEVRRRGRPVALSHRAFTLLGALAAAEGQIVSRDLLIDTIWGPGQVINYRTIDNLVVKLRQAIEADPRSPRHLLTVHGAEYRLVP